MHAESFAHQRHHQGHLLSIYPKGFSTRCAQMLKETRNLPPPRLFLASSWSRSASSLEKIQVSIFLASYHGNHEPAVLPWIRRRKLPFSLHIEKRRCMRAHWHSCAFREEIDPHTLPTRRVSYLCNPCLQTFATKHLPAASFMCSSASTRSP